MRRFEKLRRGRVEKKAKPVVELQVKFADRLTIFDTRWGMIEYPHVSHLEGSKIERHHQYPSSSGSFQHNASKSTIA